MIENVVEKKWYEFFWDKCIHGCNIVAFTWM
jgi:hypothetical protein